MPRWSCVIGAREGQISSRSVGTELGLWDQMCPLISLGAGLPAEDQLWGEP